MSANTEQPMTENPPFHRTRVWLRVMASLAEAYIDRYAIQQLWWQSSISEGGINQHLTRPVHWAART